MWEIGKSLGDSQKNLIERLIYLWYNRRLQKIRSR
jgi:hypothetical protein